jgi:acyloxyacyl hydrolase
LGDSATAHFHVPPQYLTANGWNLNGFFEDAEDELDFPQCSWGTGHVPLTECPFQDDVPDVSGTTATSLYSQMRERNRCIHNDYQNIGVNGARMTSSDGLVNALARDADLDHPVMLWLSLIGNDVCNGHAGTSHMTTPEDFYTDAMASLNKLDTLLPPDSYVVSLALFDGELLYDTMHAQQHPLGNQYKDVYDFLNCMEESPCWGWLNSNATARREATDRAKELNEVYVNIAATASFKNFKYIYYTGEWPTLFGEYGKKMGVKALPNLIEKSDGFHPSQAGNALFAKQFFAWLEKEHPDAIGPINPHNAEIDAMFF